MSFRQGEGYIAPFTFKGGRYKYYSQGQVLHINVQDMQMPDSTIVTLERRKRMSVTPVSGGYGTVKEIYGFDDWTINVEGVTDDEMVLRVFETLESLSDSIGVGNSDLFEYYNIYKVVIESLKLRQKRGKGHLISYRMKLISDEPVELIWKSE